MEKLTNQKLASVLGCLVEGNSIASTSRITSVSERRISLFIREAGEAFAEYQNRVCVGLRAEVVQLDELWSFVGCKDHSKERAILDHPGSVWTWTAICAESKLIPCWYVSQERGLPEAMAFCHDLAPRFANRPQIVSDGLQAYRAAIGMAFDQPNYAQLVKVYEKGRGGRKFVASVRKEQIHGESDMEKVSTSYMERFNLTIRMGNRRFTRLTNAYSKDLRNHCHMLAITLMHSNFARKHETIKTTPAVAAGIASRPWTLHDMILVLKDYLEAKQEDAFEAAFAQRCHKPRSFPKTYQPKARSEMKQPWYLDEAAARAEAKAEREAVQCSL